MNVLRNWTNENSKALSVIVVIAAMNHFGSLVTCYAEELSTVVKADVPVVAQHPVTSVQFASSIAARTPRVAVDDHQMACSGDVNLDGVLSQADLVDFLEAVETATTDPAMHDIAGDGSVDGRDYERLAELHQDSATVPAGGSGDPHEMSNVACCDDDGLCVEIVGGCPGYMSVLVCPCTPPQAPPFEA